MRRPLFGNGIPRNILTVDGAVELFDTSALNAADVYALTLYVWWFQPGAAPTDPTLFLTCASDGGSPIPLGKAKNTFLNALWTGPAVGSQVAPVKLLNRYMVRGDQQIFAENSVGGSDTCFVWGYLEQVGSENPPRPFRGLQPAPLVSPFVFEPAFGALAAPGVYTQTLHQLSNQFIDLVTLDVAIETNDATLVAGVNLPGGVTLPLPAESTGFPFRVFDGIPMRAPSSTDVNIGITATAAGGETLAGLAAYGSFDRY